MMRKIIKIDEAKCSGCGLCAEACHEGAIAMVDGKARLLRDDYCDGLGNCLPVCTTGAISFEEREAADYNEKAVLAAKENGQEECKTVKPVLACGCPGTQSRIFNRKATEQAETQIQQDGESMLNQWPIQIKLVPVNAPYFKGARLLVAADCSAYAFRNFHSRFMKDKITLIGCPKLDDTDYSDKLAEIIRQNDIKSITVVRMEVPCCGGLVNAVSQAILKSGKMLPWSVTIISTDGNIIEEQ